MSRAFAEAPEVEARFGAEGADLVAALDATGLGRAPDAAGAARWRARLAAGAERSAVVLAFSESPGNVPATAPTLSAWVFFGDTLLEGPPLAPCGG